MNRPTPLRAASVFRSFDETLSRAFYVDGLGFAVDFEHRAHSGAPLYLGLRLGGFSLHLSEHHGDCAPGGLAMIWMEGVQDWHALLLAKPYANNRPELVQESYGLCMTLSDPFFNRIRVVQPDPT